MPTKPIPPYYIDPAGPPDPDVLGGVARNQYYQKESANRNAQDGIPPNTLPAIDSVISEMLGKSTMPDSSYSRMDHARTGPYVTPLNPAEESQFRQWVASKKVPFDPTEKNADYDMRGYWKAVQSKDPLAVQGLDPNDKRMHFPDTWKTPYHRTFSNQSKYALPSAPKWVGNRLIEQQTGKVLFDDTNPREPEY
jgi:hypothetical protein